MRAPTAPAETGAGRFWYWWERKDERRSGPWTLQVSWHGDAGHVPQMIPHTSPEYRVGSCPRPSPLPPKKRRQEQHRAVPAGCLETGMPSDRHPPAKTDAASPRLPSRAERLPGNTPTLFPGSCSPPRGEALCAARGYF